MENTAPNSNQVAFKWSIILLVVSIIITYTFQFLNINQDSPVKYISYIPYIAFMFLAQKEYKDQRGGFMTFGQGFMAGFKFTIITAVLTTLFIYLYFSFLSPQIFQQILDSTRAKLEAKGNLTDDQIKMALSFTTVGITCIFVFIGSIIMGTIISLIGAAIFKNEPPMFASVNDDEVVQ